MQNLVTLRDDNFRKKWTTYVWEGKIACGQGRGGGVFQMSILLHKPYLVKWSTKGEVDQKCPKNCPHDLWKTPKLDWVKIANFLAFRPFFKLFSLYIITCPIPVCVSFLIFIEIQLHSMFPKEMEFYKFEPKFFFIH